MSPAEVELYPTYFCPRWSKTSGSGTASQMPMPRIDERINLASLRLPRWREECKLYICGFGACLLWTHYYKHIIEIMIFDWKAVFRTYFLTWNANDVPMSEMYGGDAKHRDSKMVTASASKKMLTCWEKLRKLMLLFHAIWQKWYLWESASC